MARETLPAQDDPQTEMEVADRRLPFVSALTRAVARRLLPEIEMPTASLAPFENAASCFDSAIVAAHGNIVSTKRSDDGTSKDDLGEINDMLRHLKSKARTVIGLLATSDLVEHRAMADVCRTRMADAINLHRTASRCIRQGVVPPLPASYIAVVLPTYKAQADPWVHGQIWFAAWAMAWTMAWHPRRS